MFTFGRRASWQPRWINSRPDSGSLGQDIARRLTPRGGGPITPTNIARFVYKNSWHYQWETTVRRDRRLLPLARALWSAGADYKHLLEEAGEVLPSPDTEQNLQRLMSAAGGGPTPYLECGHRALAAAAIAEAIGMPVRYVTLYSGWPKTSVMTHHLLELKGADGWEMHDPDYGFCFRTVSGRVASAEAVMTGAVSVAEYRWRLKRVVPKHIADLIRNGFFSAISTRDYDESETLYVSESDLALATFRHGGEELAFPEYWRSVLSQSRQKSVVFTGRPVAIISGR